MSPLSPLNPGVSAVQSAKVRLTDAIGATGSFGGRLLLTCKSCVGLVVVAATQGRRGAL